MRHSESGGYCFQPTYTCFPKYSRWFLLNDSRLMQMLMYYTFYCCKSCLFRLIYKDIIRVDLWAMKSVFPDLNHLSPNLLKWWGLTMIYRRFFSFFREIKWIMHKTRVVYVTTLINSWCLWNDAVWLSLFPNIRRDCFFKAI